MLIRNTLAKGSFSIIPWSSFVPRPLFHEKKGLVTIKHFLGCAESAVLVLNKPMKQRNVIYTWVYARQISQCHKNSKIKVADLAQPRKHSMFTRSLIFLMRGWETIMGTRPSWRKSSGYYSGAVDCHLISFLPLYYMRAHKFFPGMAG